MKRMKSQGMVAGRFWGLLRGPDKLPVLFGSKQDAIDNLDYDEYLVQVHVRPASLSTLLRGERVMLERRKAQGQQRSRPRIPDTQKRRRGSVSVKLRGVEPMRAALKKVGVKMRREIRRHLDEALAGKSGKKSTRRG